MNLRLLAQKRLLHLVLLLLLLLLNSHLIHPVSLLVLLKTTMTIAMTIADHHHCSIVNVIITAVVLIKISILNFLQISRLLKLLHKQIIRPLIIILLDYSSCTKRLRTNSTASTQFGVEKQLILLVVCCFVVVVWRYLLCYW